MKTVTTFAAAATLAAFAFAAPAAQASDKSDLLHDANITINNLKHDPAFGTARTMLQDAKAIYIVPKLVKGGFIGPPPDGMEAILRTYSAASDALLKGIENWSDADLERDDEMYGEIWKRGHGLQVLVVHQTHHRGQMTVLMRQAGLLVPSFYGPVKEGWSAYGVEPPRV